VALQPARGRGLYHGELTLDQILFMRPVPGWSATALPIEGAVLVWLGDASRCEIPGAAGRNAGTRDPNELSQTSRVISRAPVRCRPLLQRSGSIRGGAGPVFARNWICVGRDASLAAPVITS